MDEQEHALAKVMNTLKAEPSSDPAGGVLDLIAPGPEIHALREQLAALVSTGKAKEPTWVQLTHEQVKRLSDKEVEKYFKRCETYVGSKTTDSFIDSFIFLVTKAVGAAIDIKDINAYQKELRNDYIITKELFSLGPTRHHKTHWFYPPRFPQSKEEIHEQSWAILSNCLIISEKLLTIFSFAQIPPHE